MKAVYIERIGYPDVMQCGELPAPEITAGEVLIDIQAASVNAADCKTRAGRQNKPVTRFPHVLGRDFSGVVAAVGAGVEDLAVGMPVFGVCEPGQDGAYAQKIAISADKVVVKPDWLTHTQAASVALIGITAVVTLESTLQLKAGERILVQGGAGGVGGFAVQLARHLGATVATTASSANHAYIRNWGVDHIIDYQAHDFTQHIKDCDAVFDTVGGAVAQDCFRVLRSGGRAAFIASGPEAPASPRADVQALRPQVVRKRAHLQRVLSLLQTGAVALPEITAFDLSDAAAAHRVSESRHLRGKLMLQVGM